MAALVLSARGNSRVLRRQARQAQIQRRSAESKQTGSPKSCPGHGNRVVKMLTTIGLFWSDSCLTFSMAMDGEGILYVCYLIFIR